MERLLSALHVDTTNNSSNSKRLFKLAEDKLVSMAANTDEMMKLLAAGFSDPLPGDTDTFVLFLDHLLSSEIPSVKDSTVKVINSNTELLINDLRNASIVKVPSNKPNPNTLCF